MKQDHWRKLLIWLCTMETVANFLNSYNFLNFFLTILLMALNTLFCSHSIYRVIILHACTHMYCRDSLLFFTWNLCDRNNVLFCYIYILATNGPLISGASRLSSIVSRAQYFLRSRSLRQIAFPINSRFAVSNIHHAAFNIHLKKNIACASENENPHLVSGSRVPLTFKIGKHQ